MQLSFHSVLIVTKARDDEAAELGRDIAEWLEGRGVACRVQANPALDERALGLGFSPDLALVLGGDGTMLSVARQMANHRVPLLGLNLGKVGFLTEICPDNWPERLMDILDEGLNVSERLALAWELEREGRTIAQGRVINDLVINRGHLARLVDLDLFIDGRLLSRLRADGVIVATASGATGYAVSAGGPLLHPSLGVYSITAICPFMSAFRPLVLPGEARLVVRVPNNRAEVLLTLDGQEGLPVQEGDLIHVHRSVEPFFYAEPKGASYVGKLRAKGMLGDASQDEAARAGRESEHP